MPACLSTIRNCLQSQRTIFLAFLLCLAGIIFFGMNVTEAVDEWRATKDITLVIGETKPLSVNNPRQVKIANPEFLDVVGAGSKELLLSGLKEGETILTIVDSYGERKYAVQVFAEDLEKTKERIDILLEAAGYGTVSTRIGYKERKIFLTGTLPDTQKEDFQKKIASIQDKIIDLISYGEALSVEVDVEIMEIGKTDLDNLGLQWDKSVSFSEGAVGDKADDLLNPGQFFQVMRSWRTTALGATLNVLKQRNKARTLSRPKIVCLSGKEAKLLVGGERPIITNSTTTAGSGSSTQSFDIELKNYGIELSIKPTVKNDQEILISLNTEITEVDTSNQISLGAGVTTPGFTKRSAQTELTVIDGQTIFLAGLISSKRADNRDGVQGLEKVPFLGALFRHRDLSQRDTEVVITLTPKVIRSTPPTEGSDSVAVTITPSLQSSTFDKSIESLPRPVSKEDEMVQSYSRLVQNIIYSRVEYPDQLRGKSIQGTVKLSLHVQSNGKLLGVVVMRSSGNGVLDELAELTVKKLSPFPAFPAELKFNELWIDMPIVYELGNKA